MFSNRKTNLAALSLLLSAAQLTPALAAEDKTVRVCTPKPGSSFDEVFRVCGKPLAVYGQIIQTALDQKEWDYGATMVGFIQGRVSYVLVLQP